MQFFHAMQIYVTSQPDKKSAKYGFIYQIEYGKLELWSWKGL